MGLKEMATPAAGAQLVRMRDISLMFGGTTALDCVDFELVAGEIHALAGENGAGKSSLIKMLAGIYAPERGSIELQGVPTVLDSTAAASAAGIAVIHQELNLVDSLSAVDNLFLGKEMRGRWGLPDRSAMQRKAHDMLGQLGFPADIHLPVGGLRMGERQLVEIAKALLANASVLIMDEPTSALSASEAEVLYGLCRKLRDRGLGVILITHRLQEVFMLSDRITVLRDGRKIGTWATCEIASPAALVSLMIGKPYSALSNRPISALRTRDRPVLSVTALTLSTAAKRVVDNVSFDVGEGEIFGLSGLLGSGKTEVLEALLGTTPYHRDGEVRYLGQKTNFQDASESVAAGIAMVTEDRKRDGLLLDQGLEVNFLLPNFASLPRYPLYRIGSACVRAAKWAGQFNVRYKFIDQLTGTLSGGNQQKLIIGKWLLRKPRLLLLDEPTRGVDTAAKTDIYGLIRTATDAGLTVVIASAEIDELMLLCDRILVLCAGRATGILAREEFSADNLIRLAAAQHQEATSA